jgi:hypothetical protein
VPPSPPPTDHWAYHVARWVLRDGDVLLLPAFVLLLAMAGLLTALAWLQGGARLLMALLVWRRAWAWWRGRPFGHPGGAGGHTERYRAVMSSGGWRRRRAAAIRRAGRRCQRCGARGPLDVHHLTYRRLGRERPGDLLAVCERCHGVLHGRPAGGRRLRGGGGDDDPWTP